MTPEHELDSEEDEAPEEVTFQSAKSQAEESVRERRELAKREKTLRKEKIKRKAELFKEQKKKKLLPDIILQSITSLPDKREEASKQLEEQKKAGNEARGKKKTKSIRPQKRLQSCYKVARLEDYKKKDILEEKAKSFIKGRLYGNTRNRTTANEFLSLSRKRSSIKQPAVHFTDNTWGEEMKEQAENFKLRWMNKK